MTFIDVQRGTYGVEPICDVLPIAPATYFRHQAWRAHPDQRSKRIKRDGWLTAQIQRVWDENFGVYGARKVWRQLTRERDRRRALHRGAIDAADGAAGCRPRTHLQDHDP